MTSGGTSSMMVDQREQMMGFHQRMDGSRMWRHKSQRRGVDDRCLRKRRMIPLESYRMSSKCRKIRAYQNRRSLEHGHPFQFLTLINDDFGRNGIKVFMDRVMRTYFRPRSKALQKRDCVFTEKEIPVGYLGGNARCTDFLARGHGIFS